MKKLHLCLISTLLAASMHAQSIDYTKGLSIWFDKPNNLITMTTHATKNS